MKHCLFLLALFLPFLSHSQDILNGSNIHGNFQLDAQYYAKDTIIGTKDVPEKMRMNSFLNLVYNTGDFTVGARYEAYLNPLLGFDPETEYRGNGIPYRYVQYKKGDLVVTAGNFYDQFGNGLIFRSYEEPTLGIDNSIDGLHVKYSPVNGIIIKGLTGNQRYYWKKSAGIIRGADAEFFLNDLFKSITDWKTKVILGGSAVSKYQPDVPTFKYKLPQNVGAFAGRLDISRGRYHLNGEYAYKINDPCALNNYIYKPGEALFLSGSYSQKGLGIILAGKRIDNMDFRTDRFIKGNALTVNYLPPLTKQHVYCLATIYPYSTQPNGEIGYYSQVEYNIKKGTKLGGTYGTDVNISFSKINSLAKTKVNDSTSIDSAGSLGYKSKFFEFGKTTYFEDFNIEVTHKFNKNWKGIFSMVNLIYNQEVIEGHTGAPLVYANIDIVDLTYRISEKHAIRTEVQHLLTHEDKGNWMAVVAEYSIAPALFFSVMDQYNYNNPDGDDIHYYYASFGFTKGTNRIAFSYGRQRKGLLCVGGICREVPASNGLQISISSSF